MADDAWTSPQASPAAVTRALASLSREDRKALGARGAGAGAKRDDRVRVSPLGGAAAVGGGTFPQNRRSGMDGLRNPRMVRLRQPAEHGRERGGRGALQIRARHGEF